MSHQPRARQPRVLNTRVRQQAGELSQLLAEAGLVPIEAATITIQGAWDPRELEQVRLALRQDAFDWVVLASQNAAAGLQPELARVRVVCGAATARALGISAELSLNRFSASAALAALASRLEPGQRVLAPRAAEGRDELVAGLTVLGVRVEAPIAYRTAATPAVQLEHTATLVRSGDVEAITLCSPSALSGLLQVLSAQELGACAVVCLGETTAAAARAAGVRVDAVASQTSMASLVRGVQAALASREAVA